MELIEFASALGYTIVSAGKGKNNPLNHDAVPDDYREEAARRNMNPRMLVEFVDGSKTMVEMAAIANATGLVPDVPGMHGPKADRDQLAKVLIPREDGGILSKKGVVDYTIGKGVAPGVFVIVEATHPRIIERMDDLHIGKGPYYSFFRPYHLTSLEVPLTAARIMLYGRPDMVPLPIPVAEVCALAKRDLAAGEIFDAIGETCYRSWTMTAKRGARQGRGAGRPARGRQGAEGGQEGRTADQPQCRARSDDAAVCAAPAPGPDAQRREIAPRVIRFEIRLSDRTAFQLSRQLMAGSPAATSSWRGSSFERLGVKEFELVETEFANLLPGLADGRWQMTTGLFATAERRQIASFSRPIWALADGLLVRKGNPRGN